MKRILVTAIGSFSADVVIRNLKNTGYCVVGCDIYKEEWIANSLDVYKFYQSPYATQQQKYIDFIKDVCAKESIEYVVPLTDVEVDVLNKNRNQLENITICISDQQTISVCRDKYNLYIYLKEKGIDYLIPTVLLDDIDANYIEVPGVIKPRDGRSSQGLHYINSKQKLVQFIDENDISNYVFQPKIEGSVVTVDVIRNKEFFMATPRLELLRTLNGAGTSVKVFYEIELIKMAKRIADILNVRGCVNFEFIETEEGEYRFLECNPRFSGGVAFSCLAGYDYVKNHVKCFTKERLDEVTPVNEMLIARKYVEKATKICN